MPRGRKRTTPKAASQPEPKADSGNLKKETLLELYDDAVDAKAALDAASGKYRNVIKRAGALGINQAALKRVIAELNRDRDKREIDDRDFRKYMAWLGHPIGHQAEMFANDDAPAPNGHDPDSGEADEKHGLRVADREGYTAGKAGANVDSCPYELGSELAQVWHGAWHRAQKEAVHAMGETPA